MSYSIVPSHMAVITEWGPKNQNGHDRNLMKVAQFTASDLRDIGAGVSLYLQQNSTKKREHAARHIARKGLPVRRVQTGLDVINQLAAVGLSWVDVRSIVVHEDTNSTVQKTADELKNRAGEGQHHVWYEIDWVKPPDLRPEAPPRPAAHVQRTTPALTPEQIASRAEQRRRDQERNRLAREAREERDRQERRATWEREMIDNVVIDNVRQTGEAVIQAGKVKVELGEDGAAVLLYKKYASDPYQAVDRNTGKYQEEQGYSWLNQAFDRRFLRYFNALAEQAEGKETPYAPEPLSEAYCQGTYERALKADMIRIIKDPERGTTFQYAGFPHHQAIEYGTLFMKNYGLMDLDRNIVYVTIAGTMKIERLIHPDFAKFLTMKKAELDAVNS